MLYVVLTMPTLNKAYLFIYLFIYKTHNTVWLSWVISYINCLSYEKKAIAVK